MAEIESPCVGVCRLDERNVCRGCGRLIDEIIEWPSATDRRKQEIVAAARRRLDHGAQVSDPTRTQ